jgi:hypothetical protein
MNLTRDHVERLLKANEKVSHKVHQLDGVMELVNDTNPERGRVVPYAFALFNEVGSGKTKEVIDAAQILYLSGDVDTVIAVAPGYARGVWADIDPMLGEVAKHAWAKVPNVIHEFYKHYTDIAWEPGLNWLACNFEFIRGEKRLAQLLKQLRGRKCWIVVDESWNINRNSLQTKACLKVRYKRCQRATILNGTPLADGKPKDLYFPMQFLDTRILDCKNQTVFKSRYCVMGGFQGRNIVEYKNLDDLNRRVAPYIQTVRTRDCYDLPPMLPPVVLSAPFSDENWKLYKEMRDDTVAWLGTQASVSKQGVTKILRLAQMCSGFLGGLEDMADWDTDLSLIPAPPRKQLELPTDMPDFLKRKHEQSQTANRQVQPQAPAAPHLTQAAPLTVVSRPVTREIGREKLDKFLEWFSNVPCPDRMIMWCRWTPERVRAEAALRTFYPRIERLCGGQTPDERQAAKRLLAPGSQERGAVVGNQKAGGASLNFAGAPLMVFLSEGPRLIERTQAVGRIERPGATQPMSTVHVLATGPKGQKTWDHHNFQALQGKHDMANWTVAEWVKILSEE